MKKLIALVVVVAAGWLTYSYLTTGSFSLTPAAKSANATALEELGEELKAAESTYRQAGRAAGLTGMDTTADASVAIEQIKHVAERLEKLKDRLETDAERTKAAELEREIERLKREIGP